MAEKQRINWIDIAKGIAIILMVLGHSSIPNSLALWIWSFHMPLFFFASGMCTNFENDNLKQFINKKGIGIIRPFLIYSTIVLLLGWIFNIDLRFSFSSGLGGYALWFIPVLFVALILARIYFCIKQQVFKIVYIAILPISSYMLSYYHIGLPWNMAVTPFAAFLILLAYRFRANILNLCNLKYYWLIPILAISIIISQCWRLDMCFNITIPMLQLTIGAIAGSLIIARFSILIDNNTKWLSKCLMVIGQETFIIVAFSQIIVMSINTFLGINAILKYMLLVLLLFVLAYLKNIFVKCFKVYFLQI